ncbi:MAG: hypothetical protein C0404_06995 [Verrucomicrobia bacterium]|nr:hypothetical protein [Verrucomicrobiota bacterium]
MKNMGEHQRFHIKDITQLRLELDRLGLELPLSEDLAVLGERLRIGGRITSNRFIVQPMEGFDAADDGGPGELAFRRYRRYAEGGSGLIWFEATAVLPEARSNPRQLYINENNAAGYRKLVEATREAALNASGSEVICVLQLTHSGRYSKPTGIPKPIIAHHSPILDPKHKLPSDYPLVTDEYLDRLQEIYVEAAKLAREAGFDGVDVKSCHRYLVSELLASHTREGRYGGSFENRSRFLRETLARISKEVQGIFVTTRMNAFDAIEYPHGFGVDQQDARKPDLAEPVKLAQTLRELGVPLLNVSIGNPYFNPHYGRPFDFPIKGMTAPAEHPLEAIVRFAKITRTIQDGVKGLPVVASGYTWLRHLLPQVAAGLIKSGWAGLMGQGRGAFAYPDSVRDVIASGLMDPAKCCVTCSACTQIMRDGGMTGCVVRDSEIYGPQYRLARRMALDKLTEEAQRCRDCEQPTCQSACPAHVDVPAFVGAFARGEYKKAYEILRTSNVLPEMCAMVCPSEVQCEGGCLENIFCEDPVPIRDIQLETCRIARREGFTAVRLPKEQRPEKIAVIGGGPAGVACAVKLLEKGYQVALFDKDRKMGGTPDSVIPRERIEDASAEIKAIMAPAIDSGRLVMHVGRAVGKKSEFTKLRKEYNAVFLAPGLSGSTSLGKMKGVIDALTFLRQAKSGTITEVAGKVAVLGGGNTAMDAACTAMKLGAADVYVVYRRSFKELPAWPEERDKVLKQGAHFLILTQPVAYAPDEAGRLAGVRVARTELGEPDASGRRKPKVIPNTESLLEVDLAIEAIGQAVSEDLKKTLADVEFSEDGLIAVKSGSCATNIPGVFAGGDIVNGGTTAVQGVADGMRAADEIDRTLRGKETRKV